MQSKIVSLMMLSLLLVGCEKPAEPLAPPRPALVVVAGEMALNEAMVLVGEVKSRYESSLAFRINGKIIERKVDVGQQVKTGQVIARLDAADTKLTAAAALADVRVAEANHSLAQAEVERQRSLFNKKFISASALDLREAELKTSAARLQQVKAQAALSNNQSHYTALIADRDGVVTQIRAEPGQFVIAGEAIAQIVDTRKVEVLVAVPESRMANLKLGDAVTIKLWVNQENNTQEINSQENTQDKNSQKIYSGKVREIAPAANSATRAFDVRVTVIDADDAIKFGMTAGVSFAEKDVSESIVIPSTALTKLNGKSSVWVIDRLNNQIGIAHSRAVTAGQYTEDGVKILSGLRAGELVAIAGVHTLINGQKVKPVQESRFKGFGHE
ncbi:efflux RND transporter periplasmic adaptor subunit [Methylotenera versatilis]|uniref:efflux RND transporter periplasmic adaptor subunit n=1 Tax=Methylotenera versatilis TaxID=1055487 RepID=UPI00064692C9|nr:efflux RND transporter periplasmic adaptor subunit [Methylotenera versatilis]